MGGIENESELIASCHSSTDWGAKRHPHCPVQYCYIYPGIFFWEKELLMLLFLHDTFRSSTNLPPKIIIPKSPILFLNGFLILAVKQTVTISNLIQLHSTTAACGALLFPEK